MPMDKKMRFTVSVPQLDGSRPQILRVRVQGDQWSVATWTTFVQNVWDQILKADTIDDDDPRKAADAFAHAHSLSVEPEVPEESLSPIEGPAIPESIRAPNRQSHD